MASLRSCAAVDEDLSTPIAQPFQERPSQIMAPPLEDVQESLDSEPDLPGLEPLPGLVPLSQEGDVDPLHPGSNVASEVSLAMPGDVKKPLEPAAGSGEPAAVLVLDDEDQEGSIARATLFLSAATPHPLCQDGSMVIRL